MNKPEIEDHATDLLRAMWRNRMQLSQRDSDNPLVILEPQLAARHLGILFESRSGLGRFGERGNQFEVAGFIDATKRTIAVSLQFPTEVVRFTGAHEIGHMMLHPGLGAHRDRPVKGLQVGNSTSRPPREREADHFAACFLVPRRQLVREFHKRFYSLPLVIDDDAAFWLSPSDPEALFTASDESLEREVAVASARSFGGQQFDSLASLFRVSLTTMAIRLSELGLVES